LKDENASMKEQLAQAELKVSGSEMTYYFIEYFCTVIRHVKAWLKYG
jgi:hypothetical protein